MSSHVVTIIKDMKENKRIKTKIGVGSVLKAKFGEMEENTREGRSRCCFLLLMKFMSITRHEVPLVYFR